MQDSFVLFAVYQDINPKCKTHTTIEPITGKANYEPL
jgi:hypothetical protein